MNRYKNGFTLAELMAVVAILAILAGVALGSYRKSMDRAQFAEGIQGMHALASAMEDYYYEHIPNVHPTDMRKLRAGLSKSTVQSDKITTEHFTYTILTETVSSQTKPVGIKAEPNSKKYYLVTYLDSVKKNVADRCYYFGTAGREACEAAGMRKSNCNSEYCY